MKILTSYTKFTTGEGERVTFTYSEVSDKGELISQNNRGNFIAIDSELLKHIEAVDKYISNNYLKEE